MQPFLTRILWNPRIPPKVARGSLFPTRLRTPICCLMGVGLYPWGHVGLVGLPQARGFRISPLPLSTQEQASKRNQSRSVDIPRMWGRSKPTWCKLQLQGQIALEGMASAVLAEAIYIHTHTAISGWFWAMFFHGMSTLYPCAILCLCWTPTLRQRCTVSY